MPEMLMYNVFLSHGDRNDPRLPNLIITLLWLTNTVVLTMDSSGDYSSSEKHHIDLRTADRANKNPYEYPPLLILHLLLELLRSSGRSKGSDMLRTA